MEKGGFQTQPLTRLTLGLTLVFLVGFWLTNFGVYFSRMGLRPSSVAAYYLGSEEEFRPPRSYPSMLEASHVHLPMMGMVLLFLTHLATFVPLSRPAKTALIATTFGSAVLEEGAGWLVRFVSPAFAPLKVLGFLGLQSAILFLLAALGVFLWKAARAPAPAGPSAERRRAARRAAGAIQGQAASSASPPEDEPAPISASAPRQR